MRNIKISTIVVTLLFTGISFSNNAQSSAEIQNITFTAKNDTLIVTYDIEKAERKELFDISLFITTASGKLMRPRAVSEAKELGFIEDIQEFVGRPGVPIFTITNQ